MPIRSFILSILTIALLATTCRAADTKELRTWTSASGATIEAKYVESDGTTVVLEQTAGTQVRIALKGLSEADRAVAYKMAVAAGDIEELGTGEIQQRSPAHLPAYTDGKYKGINTVYECDEYRATVDFRGFLLIQLRQDGKDMGAPLVNKFEAAYLNPERETKGEPKWFQRPVARFDEPPEPAIFTSRRPPTRKIEMKGIMKDDVSLTRVIEFKPGAIRIDVAMQDPSGIEYPSHIGSRLRFPRSIKDSAYKTLDELKQMTEGWTVELKGPGKRHHDLTYWESYPFSRVENLERVEVTGPWQGRTVLVSTRKKFFYFGNYSGMPLIAGFSLSCSAWLNQNDSDLEYNIRIE